MDSPRRDEKDSFGRPETHGECLFVRQQRYFSLHTHTAAGEGARTGRGLTGLSKLMPGGRLRC